VAKMTGKLKTKKATATKQTPSKQKPAKTGKELFKSRFEPDAVVTWTGKDNPFREGCGAWTRTEIVRKSDGQKVSTIQSKEGVRGSTISTLARMKLVEVG
jgi:hypothetical protein